MSGKTARDGPLPIGQRQPVERCTLAAIGRVELARYRVVDNGPLAVIVTRTVSVMNDLQPVPEDWTTALAVIAHPDDMEYGAAAAVARWTALGKRVVYILVTDGEAGIATMSPAEVGPLRRAEQIAACQEVCVDSVEFLGLADGLVTEGLALRQRLCAVIRQHRPDVVLSINFRDSWGGPSWNHADHRAVGRALLDAVRDSANPWVFPDAGTPWPNVRFVAS